MAKKTKNNKAAEKRKGKLSPLKKRSYKSKTKKKPSKKKKLGRPRKKRLGFSSNNFNYIRSLLWKNYKSDFKGYHDPEFIGKVNEVFNECRGFDNECTDEFIMERYELIRGEEDKRPAPIIDEDLLNPKPYYEIKDVEFDLIAATFPYLWIVSPMILPAPSEFIITKIYDKQKDSYKHFREWVDWCNENMRERYGNEINSEEIEIYFRFTPSTYNFQKKRWETNIYICNGDGSINDFGFVPKGKMFDHDATDEFVEPDKKKGLPTPEEEIQQIEKIRIKKANIDLQSALDDLRSKLRKEFKKQQREEEQTKIITIKNKKETIELLQEILKIEKDNYKFYKKRKYSRKAKEAEKEIKEINKQIREIRKTLR